MPKKPLSLMARIAMTRFVLCVKNKGYLASLVVWKVYQILPDDKAAQHDTRKAVWKTPLDIKNVYRNASFWEIIVWCLTSRAINTV